MGLDWGMILGGFGLFMFGIKFMGDGLKAVAGDKLRDYINRFTSNKISALLLCLPHGFSGRNAADLGFVVLCKDNTVPFLYAAAYGYRIRFQIGIQEALNGGVEIVHVCM